MYGMIFFKLKEETGKRAEKKRAKENLLSSCTTFLLHPSEGHEG